MLQEQTIEQAAELNLHERIDQLEKQVGIYLTLHDLRGLLSLELRDHLLPGRRWHRCPYCWEGRFNTRGWNANCDMDCMYNPHRRCRTDSTPYWKKCWKGVWELVVPISRNGQNMLILFAGLFRDDEPESLAMIDRLPAFHRKAYRNLPLKCSIDELPLVSTLLFFGHALLEELEESARELPNVPGNMKDIILRYIIQNAVRNITLDDLAEHLHLSKSRTVHAVKQYLGKNFGMLLREERMARAVNLLSVCPRITIAELSACVGYQDPAYFMRLFSKTYGMGPRSYQKSQKWCM